MSTEAQETRGQGSGTETKNESPIQRDETTSRQAQGVPDSVLASVITQASPNTPVIMTTPPEAESTKTGPTVVDTTAPAAQTTTTDTKTPASASLSSTAESSKATVESSTLAAVPVSTVPKQQPAPSSTNDRQIASAGTTRPAQTDAQANRAITNAPRTSPSRKPKAAPKKKSGLAKFFAACLPCGAAAAYEDESHDQKPSTSRQTAVKPQPSTTSPTSTEKQTVAPTTNDEKAAIASADSTPLATQPTSDAQLATVAATANASPEGVTLPPEETAGMTSGAVMAPGKEATGSTTVPKARRRRSGKGGGTAGIITSVPEPGAESTESSSDSSDDDDDEDDDIEDDEDEEQALIARGGVGIPIGEDGLPHPLLAELAADMQGRKCLVLDLDETLVHSSFKMVQQADYVVPVEIESQYHNVFVIKRPGVDAFLKAMGDIYEVVVFTASLSKYADPVLDHLDVHRVVKHRLFRESCYNNKGNYVKDLSQLGRPMADCIIIDNSPASYVFHQHNAVPISSWFNDPHDTELTDLVPFLHDLHEVDDVRSVLDARLSV